MADLSSRDRLTGWLCKAETVYCLAFCGKSWSVPRGDGSWSVTEGFGLQSLGEFCVPGGEACLLIKQTFIKNLLCARLFSKHGGEKVNQGDADSSAFGP